MIEVENSKAGYTPHNLLMNILLFFLSYLTHKACWYTFIWWSICVSLSARCVPLCASPGHRGGQLLTGLCLAVHCSEGAGQGTGSEGLLCIIQCYVLSVCPHPVIQSSRMHFISHHPLLWCLWAVWCLQLKSCFVDFSYNNSIVLEVQNRQTGIHSKCQAVLGF